MSRGQTKSIYRIPAACPRCFSTKLRSKMLAASAPKPRYIFPLPSGELYCDDCGFIDGSYAFLTEEEAKAYKLDSKLDNILGD